MSDIVATFRELHSNTTPLRLPNAWDAGSARLFESLGSSAIATTSAGVAWALGYRDGRLLPLNELVAAASRMARVLEVPWGAQVFPHASAAAVPCKRGCNAGGPSISDPIPQGEVAYESELFRSL